MRLPTFVTLAWLVLFISGALCGSSFSAPKEDLKRSDYYKSEDAKPLESGDSNEAKPLEADNLHEANSEEGPKKWHMPLKIGGCEIDAVLTKDLEKLSVKFDDGSVLECPIIITLDTNKIDFVGAANDGDSSQTFLKECAPAVKHADGWFMVAVEYPMSEDAPRFDLVFSSIGVSTELVPQIASEVIAEEGFLSKLQTPLTIFRIAVPLIMLGVYIVRWFQDREEDAEIEPETEIASDVQGVEKPVSKSKFAKKPKPAAKTAESKDKELTDKEIEVDEDKDSDALNQSVHSVKSAKLRQRAKNRGNA